MSISICIFIPAWLICGLSTSIVMTVSLALKPLITLFWPVSLTSIFASISAPFTLCATSLNVTTDQVFWLLFTVLMVCALKSMMVAVSPLSVIIF